MSDFVTMHSSALTSTLTLVNIGTHSLALYTHGPEPNSSISPVVLFVSGIASSSLVWAATVRLLSSSLRSYTYDRSGYRNSEPSPVPPTAENIALELSLLINEAPISNPVIIVGHSWAGVLTHEFISLTGNGPHIAGLVLVDANHETQPLVLNVNDPALGAIAEGLEPYSAKGIEAEHKLTQEEWDAFRSDERTEKHQAMSPIEAAEYELSFETLRKKGLSEKQPLLGNKPVYVIGGRRSRDWSGLLKAGIEKGNGTEEQRSHVKEMIRTADKKSEGLMKEFLKVSTKSKLVFADESGHFVQLTQPDMVVDAIKWVLDNVDLSS